jgi:hypothetical protein
MTTGGQQGPPWTTKRSQSVEEVAALVADIPREHRTLILLTHNLCRNAFLEDILCEESAKVIKQVVVKTAAFPLASVRAKLGWWLLQVCSALWGGWGR